MQNTGVNLTYYTRFLNSQPATYAALCMSRGFFANHVKLCPFLQKIEEFT